MRNPLLFSFLVAIAPVGPARAEDAPAHDRAFVEVAVPRTTYFVGEPVRLTLRFGYDAEYFRMHVIPVFRRALDVPVRIEAPWTSGISGTLDPAGDVVAEEPNAQRLTLVVNDYAIAAPRVADVVRDGRAFTVLEIERRFVPRRAGDIALSAPVLRYAYTSRFDDDLVHGRVPTDRNDAVIAGTPRVVTIRALPADGRPADFGGAIGRFTVQAEVARPDVTAGESLSLSLRIAGDGNLGAFDPPRLDALPGFHVYGMLDDRGRTIRTVTYDIAPLSDSVREVPSIAFDYFDTTPPGTYRSERTKPIPIAVRSRDGSSSTPTEPPPVPPPATPRSAFSVVLTIVEVALTAALLFAMWRSIRRRAGAKARVEPTTERGRVAAAEFRAQTAAPGADVSGALAAYLAARLDCAPAAVIAPDLAARLVAAGVPAALAARTAELIERAVAARYGGAASHDAGSDAARALVEELEVAFDAPSPAR